MKSAHCWTVAEPESSKLLAIPIVLLPVILEGPGTTLCVAIAELSELWRVQKLLPLFSAFLKRVNEVNK